MSSERVYRDEQRTETSSTISDRTVVVDMFTDVRSQPLMHMGGT